MTQETKTLNKGQQAAADGFFQFLFSDARELIISGPGGVGKTFLMGYLIDDIMPRYEQTCQLMGLHPEYNNVQMTATTNKAVDVLSHSTGRPAETAHSFFNLKVKDDYSTGRSQITKSNSWVVHQNTIIFVDECSMIDRQLLAFMREGTSKCKIVYVGDHCQLAPVHEPISPVYNQNLPFFELTEPMRTGCPHLQNLNLQMRDTVETGEFYPIQLVPGVIEHLDSAQMEAKIDEVFLDGKADARILAYTNRRVTDYNNHVRAIRQINSTYIEGERLINNSAVTLKTCMLSVEEEVTITNLSLLTEMVEIEDGVFLECRRATLTTDYHGSYDDVMLPEDKAHFNQLVKHYQQQKRWPMYYKLKNNYPDLRPRDSATVHKSQGSSHDYVFVDLGDISTCHNPNQAARMLYVAFSRARHGIFLYGDLASKYGGLVK
jgi:GTPase SAR1 family protein